MHHVRVCGLTCFFFLQLHDVWLEKVGYNLMAMDCYHLKSVLTAECVY